MRQFFTRLKMFLFFLLFGFTGAALILLLIQSKAWPAETMDIRLSRLEKQIEIQQREILFLYAQINCPYTQQIKEPKELKEAIKRYKRVK